MGWQYLAICLGAKGTDDRQLRPTELFECGVVRGLVSGAFFRLAFAIATTSQVC